MVNRNLNSKLNKNIWLTKKLAVAESMVKHDTLNKAYYTV